MAITSTGSRRRGTRHSLHELKPTHSLANLMSASFRFVEDLAIHHDRRHESGDDAGEDGADGAHQAAGGPGAGFGGGSALRSGICQVLTSFPFFIILSEVNSSLFRRSANWRAVARGSTAAMYVLPPAAVFGVFGTPANPTTIATVVGLYLLVFLLPAAYPGIRALRKYRAAHHLVRHRRSP